MKISEAKKEQPTNITDNLETMIKQNERIIKQNDETAIQDRADTFIGTIALLIIILSLVIYGFQLRKIILYYIPVNRINIT